MSLVQVSGIILQTWWLQKIQSQLLLYLLYKLHPFIPKYLWYSNIQFFLWRHIDMHFVIACSEYIYLLFIYYSLYLTSMAFCYAIYYAVRLIRILYLLVDVISLFHRSIYISMDHPGILRIVAVSQQLAIHYVSRNYSVRSSECQRASDI